MLVLTIPDTPLDDTAGATEPAAHQMLTPWACGGADEAGTEDPDQCSDIIPELFCELL